MAKDEQLLGELIGTVKGIDSKVDAHRLEMKERFDKQEERMNHHSTRLTDLERKLWVFSGGAAVVAWIASHWNGSK